MSLLWILAVSYTHLDVYKRQVLDEQGAFRGGAILPGANLALSSLAGGTALLPDIPLAVPENGKYKISDNRIHPPPRV